MHTKKSPFNFSSTYLNLPSIFYSLSTPERLDNPELLYLNEDLLKELSIEKEINQLTEILSGYTTNYELKTYAQAYAGHQFGHFNMLGDGRAILLGEHLTANNTRYDLQLKGAGRTNYSRGGDGKATINSMLREYLISEAMHHLNIATSRSLSLFKSNEPIYRDKIYERGILCRVMKSYLRVGTFQFAAYFGKENNLENLLEYTVKRHFPKLIGCENLALSFLEKVMQLQINLVTDWVRVGFIHGVMNTDNVSIIGETFDYGPCAFMNSYNPKTVFSSIDVNGRYSFENQPKILMWNIIKLAESLLPLIDSDTNKAILLAQDLINKYQPTWENNFYKMMSNKLGLDFSAIESKKIVDELLVIIEANKLDYTNTFTALYFYLLEKDFILKVPSVLNEWRDSWEKYIKTTKEGVKNALQKMQKNNPVFIPRNHLVEEAILNATNKNYLLFNKLFEVYKNPYLYQEKYKEFLYPPINEFENNYQTFCGT